MDTLLQNEYALNVGENTHGWESLLHATLVITNQRMMTNNG